MDYEVKITNWNQFPKKPTIDYPIMIISGNTPDEALKTYMNTHNIKKVTLTEHNRIMSKDGSRITYYYQSDCGTITGVVRKQE